MKQKRELLIELNPSTVKTLSNYLLDKGNEEYKRRLNQLSNNEVNAYIYKFVADCLSRLLNIPVADLPDIDLDFYQIGVPIESDLLPLTLGFEKETYKALGVNYIDRRIIIVQRDSKNTIKKHLDFPFIPSSWTGLIGD